MIINEENAKQWSRMGSRKTFGLAIYNLIKKYPDVMVVAADVAHSSGLTDLAREYPENFINVGIAEQNMIGVSAGLAKEGFKVFAVSFAPFASMRAFEMNRTYLGYMNLNVTVVGLGSGASLGMQGNTHYGLEDISLMRVIPNMCVLSPADCSETVKCVEALFEFQGPSYLRLSGESGSRIIYKEDYPFSIGKGNVLVEGSDVAIIATGNLVAESLRASRALEKQGISTTVVDMHTIKPLDLNLLESLFAKHKLIVTAEENFISGGLGGAVAECLTKSKYSVRQLMVGFPDSFLSAASQATIFKEYHLEAKSIVAAITDTFCINEMDS